MLDTCELRGCVFVSNAPLLNDTSWKNTTSVYSEFVSNEQIFVFQSVVFRY